MALFDRFERFLDQVIPPPEEAVRAVRHGERLLAAGDADAALRLAERALREAPGFVRALTLQVDALSALKRPFDALQVLESAHAVTVIPVELLARGVALAAALGLGARAADLDASVRARLKSPDREVANRLSAAAQSLIDRGDDALGLRLARTATLADAQAVTPWLLLGRDAVLRGDRERARDALDRALARVDLVDASGHRQIAEIASFLGDKARAMRGLRRAWILGDEDALGALLGALAEGDDRQAFEKVLADAPGGVGEIVRALDALSRGDDPAARVVLSAVRGGGVASGLWPWALRVLLRADLDLAAQWCRSAPERDGSAAVLRLHEAKVLIEAGDRRAALGALGDALDATATRAEAEALFRRTYREVWRAGLDEALETVAALVATGPAGEACAASLRLLRQGLSAPLRVALLGEFSAGKSTFLNALVGETVSPMGVLPTTAAVHWLRSGPRAARVVTDRGWVVESSIDEAPRVAARLRQEGQQIEHVEVCLERGLLARLELLDTPGFNAGEPAHEAAVRRAFALADVALWLFDARQAGRMSEREPLEAARDAGVSVFGVLNKVDGLSEAERETLVAYLNKMLGELAPCVHAVSAREALDAEGRGRAWEALVGWIDAHLVGQREAWKRARAASKGGAVLDQFIGEIDELDRHRRRASDALDALDVALRELAEALPAVVEATRYEVQVSLAAQLQALGAGRVEDRESLIEDAIAEAAWRARKKGLAALGEPLARVTALAVEAALVPREVVSLVTAPVSARLDAAAALGAADARASRSALSSVVGRAQGAAAVHARLPGDALEALEIAIDARRREVVAGGAMRRLAVTVLREVLGEVARP